MGSSLEKRFWSKVEKTDGCWLWTGAVNTAGYGVIGRGGRSSGNWRATWVAVFLATNEWPPKGMYVCHRCDVRACVRPEHLYVGTPKQNVADMWARKRQAGQFNPAVVGSRHNKSTLTELEVLKMREMAGTHTRKALAQIFKTSVSNVGLILRRKAWTHI